MSARQGAAATPWVALKTRTAAKYPPMSRGSSSSAGTAPSGSLDGSGLISWTVTGRPSLWAASRNAGSTKVWANSPFAGTTISVSVELPVMYAPYRLPWLIAVVAADWLGKSVKASPAFEATAATTGDGEPTTPKG